MTSLVFFKWAVRKNGDKNVWNWSFEFFSTKFKEPWIWNCVCSWSVSLNFCPGQNSKKHLWFFSPEQNSKKHLFETVSLSFLSGTKFKEPFACSSRPWIALKKNWSRPMILPIFLEWFTWNLQFGLRSRILESCHGCSVWRLRQQKGLVAMKLRYRTWGRWVWLGTKTPIWGKRWGHLEEFFWKNPKMRWLLRQQRLL